MPVQIGGTTVIDDSRNITGISISGLTTPLSVAQGGTGVTTSTGTTNVVLSTSPTLTTPTIASANLTTALTLAGAAGTNGQVLTSAGSGLPTWTTIASSSPTLVRSARSSNTVLAAADASTLIDITSGTFSQTFTAAATLGSGWFCYIRNSGTGVITLDPNASELIDGLATYIMYPQETRLVQCTGTAFTSVVVSPFFATFTTTGTFTKPPGYTQFGVRMFGGGGGGGGGVSSTSGYACSNAHGGGGGGQRIIQIPASSFGTTETVTVGAGGAGQAGGTATPPAEAGIGGITSLFTGANLINATGGGKASASAGGGGGGSGTDLVSAGIGAGPKYTYFIDNAIGNPLVEFGGCNNGRRNQNVIGLSGAGSSSRNTQTCGNVGSSEYGGSAGARQASAGTPYPAGPSLFGATGGGHGKSTSSGGASSGGAVGYVLSRNNIPACGAAAGTTGPGTAGSVLSTGAGGGGGGGGGCGSLGKAGGAGAQPGGGGGGGGNSITNGTGGAGGNGGDGIVYIWGVV